MGGYSNMKCNGYQPTPVYGNAVYIAGSVKNNLSRVQDICDILRYAGWRTTYDWTKADQNKIWTDDAYRQRVIYEELWGIKTADVFILVLPPGRGAHVELGYALAMNKKVFILAQDESQLKEVLIYNKASFTVVYSLCELLQELDKSAKWKKASPERICPPFELPTKNEDDPLPF